MQIVFALIPATVDLSSFCVGFCVSKALWEVFVASAKPLNLPPQNLLTCQICFANPPISTRFFKHQFATELGLASSEGVADWPVGKVSGFAQLPVCQVGRFAGFGRFCDSCQLGRFGEVIFQKISKMSLPVFPFPSVRPVRSVPSRAVPSDPVPSRCVASRPVPFRPVQTRLVPFRSVHAVPSSPVRSVPSRFVSSKSLV